MQLGISRTNNADSGHVCYTQMLMAPLYNLCKFSFVGYFVHLLQDIFSHDLFHSIILV